jgi:hypothetical protein
VNTYQPYVTELTLTQEKIITSSHQANVLHQSAISVLNTVPDKVRGGGGRRKEGAGKREDKDSRSRYETNGEAKEMEGAGTSSGDKRETMNYKTYYLKASKLFFLLANHHISSPETRGLTDEVTTLLPLLYPSP